VAEWLARSTRVREGTGSNPAWSWSLRNNCGQVVHTHRARAGQRAGLTSWHLVQPYLCSDPGQVAYLRRLRSTQPFILNWWINRVLADSIGVRAGDAASVGWQVTLCDPIWHAGSRSGEVLVALTTIHCLPLPYLNVSKTVQDTAGIFLQRQTDRKSYMIYRMVPFSMTMNDP